MKRNLGIIRKKNAIFLESKDKILKKKTRFQAVHQEDSSYTCTSVLILATPTYSENMMTSTSIN